MNPYVRPVPQEPGVNPWLVRVPLLMLLGAVLMLVTVAALLAFFRVSYEGRITPGVSAFGVDLSGLIREEAIATLNDRFTYKDTAVFNFVEGSFAPGGQHWQLSAADLGVNFDIEATVDQALALGSSGNIVGDLLDQGRTWFNGEAVAPIIRYDQGVALAQLQAIAEAVNQPAHDASLSIQGTEVVTEAGQVGRELDVNATLIALDHMIMTLSPGGDVPLYLHESAPTIWNADEAAGLARAALSGPLELVADGPNGERLGPWTADVNQIVALLDVQLLDNGDGTQRYDISIDMSAFQGYLETLAPGLITAPKNGRFNFDDASGQLVVVQPAVNGRELNVAETLTRLEHAVFRFDDRSVPMAFNYTQPRYHNSITAAELGITGLVSEATTYYTGSTANRRHNIAHGASLYDGVIIGPGEEFSFNDLLGEMSEAAGFMESSVIVGERTVDGIGGGICQVSTTVFRAAFTGGYAIIERNNHAYRVGFYELNGPPGMDAAIWTPDRDFRFQNDTPYHLLIETSVYPANNVLQFRFYSTNPGRVVEIGAPIIRDVVPALPAAFEPNRDLQPGEILQVDWAAEGADVTVPRIIRDRDGNIIKQDSTYTHYLPWRAVYQVAPSDSRLNG